MRLNKYLARCGIASRRKCDKLIESEKISVNGKIMINFSYQVQSDDIVMCNGKVFSLDETTKVYLLNKPKGYICTSNDTHNRKKVVDLIESESRIFTVGRLDRDTTGVLLLTNDGDVANRLLHPKYNKIKKYLVSTNQKLDIKIISSLKNGYILKDRTKVRADIYLLEHKNDVCFWDISLTEGKNREIKRIFNEFDIKVKSIHRYNFAGFKLGNIKNGAYRILSKREVNAIIQK